MKTSFYNVNEVIERLLVKKNLVCWWVINKWNDDTFVVIDFYSSKND